MKAKTFLSIFGAAILALAAFAADARIANVSWTNATTDVDGVTIPTTGPEALASTLIEWSLCGTGGVFGPTVLGTLSIPATTPGARQTAQTPNLGRGLYCFRLRHFTVDNTEGNNSAVIQFQVNTGRPRGPSSVVVN